MASKMLREEFWAELERARELLITNPLVASLERVTAPMNRAMEMLAGSPPLAEYERERLSREVAGIGQLLEGLGDWLATRGAIQPTYNRHAEFETGASVGAGGYLAVEG